MNFKKYDPLIWIFLSSGFVLLIISGGLSTFAFANIQVERIQLNNNTTDISALLLYPSSIDSQRPAILAYHGWGGTKENILITCLDFVKAGFVVLTPDLRGHGESGGVSTLGLVEQADAKVAIDYLISRTDLVNTSALAVWGASFGGMISLLAAGNDPRITAAIAVSAPSNTTAWLEERDFRTNERISYRPYMLIDPSNLTAIEERSPINSINNIKNLLVMHGELDPLVPVHHAKDLIKASNNPNHRLIIFSGEEHNINGERVKKETTQFLKNVFSNPYTTILTVPSNSYFFLMLSWIVLLLGGLLATLGILSFFPIIQQRIISKWKIQKSTESPPLGELLVRSLVILLSSYLILHTASVQISLVIVRFFSTLLGLMMSTISTICLLIIGTVILRVRPFVSPSNEQLKKWGVETGFTLIMILLIYCSFVLLADHSWIPFNNLKTVIRLFPILFTISIFLGVDSLFYWHLVHEFVTRLNNKWYIPKMSLIYLLSKCSIFFSLITWWNLLEFRFIVYGFILFGSIGMISAFIRSRWGFHSTLTFSIITGLTLYSTISILFFLL
ncbi:MAG: alpha/beta fold hydrolase [Candidatus Heimdallarchaeota archaeon]|nr:MAG: alpha/beta fold hydrolase [Candidatus Heimdallarchaeota archaeon]